MPRTPPREKAREFTKGAVPASPGKTAFSVCNTYLVSPEKLTPMQLVDRMSKAPAEIYGLTDHAVPGEQFRRLVLLDWDTEKVYRNSINPRDLPRHVLAKLTGSPKERSFTGTKGLPNKA